jgi:glycosyltransferase involved in cell wall biosynthesis
MGEIPEPMMRERFRDHAAFVSFGTVPAAVVMSQIEAWCAGIPTVIYDNGFGIAEENMELLLSNDVKIMINHTQRLLADKGSREFWHKASLKNRERFNVKTVGPQWVEFINRILR